MRDVNLELGGLLLDMATLAGNSQRAWGYKRAAKAVLRLDRHITPLVEANTFHAVPGIGPTTDRIARELIHDGTSAFVEEAIRAAGKEEAIAKLRGVPAALPQPRRRGRDAGAARRAVAGAVSRRLPDALGLERRLRDARLDRRGVPGARAISAPA